LKWPGPSVAAEEAGDLDRAIQRLLDEVKSLIRRRVRKTRWARKFAGRDLLGVAACCRKPDND